MTLDSDQHDTLKSSATKSDTSEEVTLSHLDSEKIKLFSGFSKLNRKKRYEKLMEMGALSPEDVKFLKKGGVRGMELAHKLIENVVGYFQVPLGVATNFVIDSKPVVIPMAVEETSIIAAASKTARWISEHGSIRTSVKGQCSIGQIQIHQVKNFNNLQHVVQKNQDKWIQMAHEEVIPKIVSRGGGIKEFQVRSLPNSEMAVIHVLINTCDAMGANIINQVCEFLKSPIEQESGEDVSICILSNLSDKKLVRAEVVMKDVDPQLAQKIEKASRFAELDPYRAATSNKGVMNGIDAVLMATGNDYRAVEAGVHAYAASTGTYKSITKWRAEGSTLHGTLEAPFMVGTVGGMTRIHPTAKVCMNMMDIQSAEELSRICAAVGLVQNLGAIRALVTVGIIEGHMRLHIKNITQDSGAQGWEFSIIQKHLESLFKLKKRISLSHAKQALELIRENIRQLPDFKNVQRKQKKARDILKNMRDKYKS